MNIWVVIPAFNAYERVAAVVHAAQEQQVSVLVVDDGSADATAARAEEAGALVVRHHDNRGKGASLRTGMAKAMAHDATHIICMDADGQHDAAEIAQFRAYAQTHPDVDVIVGNRMHTPRAMPWVRRLTNRCMSSVLSRMMQQDVPDTQCGYRLVTSRLLRRIILVSDRYEIESELLVLASRAGAQLHSIPVQSIYRAESSHIHPLRDTLRFIQFLLAHRMPAEDLDGEVAREANQTKNVHDDK